MAVTARAEYACLAMIELAALHPDPKPVRLADIAEKHEIPQRFLVQILLQLKSLGLVQTARGASGGYRLGKPPDEITLADILGAFDSAEEPVERIATQSTSSRSLKAVWKKLSEARLQVLREVRLSHLLPQNTGSDYVI